MVVIAVLGGLAGALQSQMLGVMEERVGTLASTLVAAAGGGLSVIILMLVFQGNRVSELRELPWWLYGAGLMGLVVVAALGRQRCQSGARRGADVVHRRDPHPRRPDRAFRLVRGRAPSGRHSCCGRGPGDRWHLAGGPGLTSLSRGRWLPWP